MNVGKTLFAQVVEYVPWKCAPLQLQIGLNESGCDSPRTRMRD